MKIHQIWTESPLRNFSYLISYGRDQAICLDPFHGPQIEAICRKHQWRISHVINTHEHWDHVQGNDYLVQAYHCEVWAHPRAQVVGQTGGLQAGDRIPLGEDTALEVMETPGHTFAHICLLLGEKDQPRALFTGDTLFNAGVGHCRSGDPHLLFQTIDEKFMGLDDLIKVYPGHDYLENNLAFTLSVEPDNQAVPSYLERYGRCRERGEWFVATLEDEKRYNTFLRLESPSIQKRLREKQDQVVASRVDVFLTLRKLRDQW